MDEADFTILEMVAACGSLALDCHATTPALRHRVASLVRGGYLVAATGAIDDLLEGRSTLTVALTDFGFANLQGRLAA